MTDENDYRCPYTNHLCSNAWDCANCDVTADVRRWEHDEKQEADE